MSQPAQPQTGPFTDPSLPTDKIQESAHESAGPTSRVWYDPRTWKTEGWILLKRSYNEFERTEVPRRARIDADVVATGRTREVKEGDRCWTECEYVTQYWISRYYLVTQRHEWWRLNRTLEAYYEHTLGMLPDGVKEGLSLAGGASVGTAVKTKLAGGTVATGTAATATLSAGILALGVGVALWITKGQRAYWKSDEVLVSSAWEIDPERSGFGPRQRAADSDPFWRICGEVRVCRESEETPATPGTGVVPGGGSTPVPEPALPRGLALPFGGCLWAIIAAVVLIAAATVLLLLRGGGDDGTFIGVADPSPRVTEEATATTGASPTATEPAPSPTPGMVTGRYSGEVTVARDPAGHVCCVMPASAWDIRQVRNTQTNEVAITLSNVLPGITLNGPVETIGQEFTAAGSGTVAGYPDVAVSFTGTASAENGLAGVLTVGGNGALPQGEAIEFDVMMQKVP